MPGLGTIAGTIIMPGVGTAIGGILDSFSLSIRGRTEHFSWEEAAEKGRQAGREISHAIAAGYTDAEMRRVYPILRAKLLAWLPGAAMMFWGQNQVQWAISWIETNTPEQLPFNSATWWGGTGSWTGERGLYALIHIPAVWILLNMDMSSTDEFGRVMRLVIDATLAPAAAEAGLPKVSASGGGGGVTVDPDQTPEGKVKLRFANILTEWFANPFIKWAVIIGIGIGGILVWRKTFK